MGRQNHKIALQSERGSPLLYSAGKELFRSMGTTVSYGREVPSRP
jgi:hypothetical protein